jgi:ABC-2 type transport system permease protein
MFIKLMGNECLKLHAKKQVYFFALFLLSISSFVLLVAKKWLPKEMGIDTSLEFAKLNFDSTVTFLTICGIVLGAKIVTEEFQTGIIKQLLIRPQKRIVILLSKYAAVLLTVFALSLVSLFLYCSE